MSHCSSPAKHHGNPYSCLDASMFEPYVVECLVLFIALSCAVIACFWQVWPPPIDSPARADLCPQCGRGLISRVAASQQGHRLYRCEVCAARYQRKSRTGPWVDAAGPEYDDLFSRSERQLPSGRVVALQMGSFDSARNVRALLRNKRIREAAQGANFGATSKRPFKQAWTAATAQRADDWRGLWDSELDG